MRDEPVDERGVTGIDLLAGQSARLARDRDQPESAGGEHDRGVGDHRRFRRVLVPRLAQPSRRFGPPRLGVGITRCGPTAQPADQLRQRFAGAFDERRTLGLAVIGQHHDPVRSRRPLGRPLDAPDLPVEISQHGERVGTFGSGVMGNLVVAEQVDVDRRPSLTHVVDDALDRNVAADHCRERPEQGIRPAAVHSRLDVATSLEAGCPALPPDLGDHRQQRAGCLLGSGEVAEVAGSEASLLLATGTAHRQHCAFGVAGEEVAVARPVVCEQSVAVRMRLFDRRCPLRVVGHDDVAGRLVDPAKRRHVDGRAVEDPALADTGL